MVKAGGLGRGSIAEVAGASSWRQHSKLRVNCPIRVDTDWAGGLLERRAMTRHRHYGLVVAIGMRSRRRSIQPKRKNAGQGLTSAGHRRPRIKFVH